MHKKNTKIVCTLGPASDSKKVLRRMIQAGMNVARLNFSHGTYENFEKIIRNIRAVSKELKIPIAIMQDLQGPKIRVGKMPESGIKIKKNQTIKLSTKAVKGSKNIIPVMYKDLPKDIKAKDKILINDGLIELQVISTNKKDTIHCKVITDGTVFTHKGINVPTASIKAEVITKKDKKDLAFGLKQNVDYVALSFVKSAKDIRDLRKMIQTKKSSAKIIAKIERHEAVRNLESIIEEADGIMVARGDLGTEISPAKVPIVQKKMIDLTNLHGKPVITATEMLQSMVKNPRATRAEVSDTANAIFDHTDAVMLSNETAVGKYPVKAVQTLFNVAMSTEKELQLHEDFIPYKRFPDIVPVSYALCSSASKLAVNINAKLIVTLTHSGFTAMHIAKHRIYIPIITITDNPKIQRQLQLVWGIRKVFVEKNSPLNFIVQVKKIIKKNKLAKKNDKIVIVVNATKKEKHISTIVL